MGWKVVKVKWRIFSRYFQRVCSGTGTIIERKELKFFKLWNRFLLLGLSISVFAEAWLLSALGFLCSSNELTPLSSRIASLSTEHQCFVVLSEANKGTVDLLFFLFKWHCCCYLYTLRCLCLTLKAFLIQNMLLLLITLMKYEKCLPIWAFTSDR